MVVRERLRSQGFLWGVLAVLVVLTVAVRAPDAVGESFWADEVSSGHIIVTPSPRVAYRGIRRESSPPVWFVLGRVTHGTGKALAKVSGALDPLRSLGVVRLLSVLFSAALVAVVVLYARRLLGLPAAALAGFAVAIGFQFVLHGKELRAYALLMLLAAAFPLFLEWVVERPTARRLAALAAYVAVGSMTHYFFLLVLFTGLLWLWTAREGAGRRLRTTVAAGIGLLPLVAWLPVVLYQAGRVNEYFPSFTVERVVVIYSKFFASGSVWGVGNFWARAAFAAAVVAGAVVLARRSEGRLCALLATVPVAVTGFVWLLGLRVFDTRNLLVAAPFVAIALVALLAAIPVRPLAVAAGVAAAGVMAWAFWVDRELGRTPYDEITGALTEMGWTSEEPLLVHARYPQTRPLSWHLPGHPRVRISAPGLGDCNHVYAVVERPGGRAWLRGWRSHVVSARTFPWYGSQLAAERSRPAVVVAELDFSRELLEDAYSDGAFLLKVRGGSDIPCLAPKG